MPISEKQRILRAIWRDKMHVESRALALSPPEVRGAFEHIWEPAELLMKDLERLPTGMLRTWRDSERGHLVFTHRPSLYNPGPQPWRETTIESVCYLSLASLALDKMSAVLRLFNLLDHLLGSGARAGEPWLSDGGGISEALRKVAMRFVRIHALGYGVRDLGVTTAGEYFAHTLWLYLHDSRRLKVIDPLVFKLYRHTLLSESFWPRD